MRPAGLKRQCRPAPPSPLSCRRRRALPRGPARQPQRPAPPTCRPMSLAGLKRPWRQAPLCPLSHIRRTLPRGPVNQPLRRPPPICRSMRTASLKRPWRSVSPCSLSRRGRALPHRRAYHGQYITVPPLRHP
ncbi:hypothetical protein U9M48_002619 [Paspalum notatum var. saurae]|uniref:Uncharacterized protein n=1 Tax=Paspalum notatum var. saurae TaxID=547442 RepID=A0AAQ3PLB7_PASNO